MISKVKRGRRVGADAVGVNVNDSLDARVVDGIDFLQHECGARNGSCDAKSAQEPLNKRGLARPKLAGKAKHLAAVEFAHKSRGEFFGFFFGSGMVDSHRCSLHGLLAFCKGL